MSEAEAIRLFNQANHLWFAEGYYNEALPVYRQALKEDPSSPIILYQLANVLWAFEEFEEAKELVSEAEKHQERFSEYGKEIFAQEKQRLLVTSKFKYPMLIPRNQLNMDRIDLMEILDCDRWVDIYFAAEERHLFKLAAHAFMFGFSLSDAETGREWSKLDIASGSYRNSVELMMPEKDHAKLEKAEVMRGFNQGNKLWFHEGRYNRTGCIYRNALEHDPSCPAILYQLANVYWAFEHFDEVKKTVELLEEHQNRFGSFGRKIFEREKPRLLETSGFKTKMPRKVERLDFEYIVALEFSKYSWMQISYAAKERHWFKLAGYAFKKGFQLNDPESKKQQLELSQANQNALKCVELMMKETEAPP